MSSIFAELDQVEEESVEKILSNMLDSDDIEMKSDLPRPINITRLYVFANWLRAEGLEKCADSIELFCKKFMILQVSNKRQSRKEIIDAIKGLGFDRTNEKISVEK